MCLLHRQVDSLPLPPLLLLYNRLLHTEIWNYSHGLFCSSVYQNYRYNMAKFFIQVPTGWNQGVRCLNSHLDLAVLFQDNLVYWQNSVAWGCTTEGEFSSWMVRCQSRFPKATHSPCLGLLHLEGKQWKFPLSWIPFMLQMTSLVAQMVTRLSTMQETRVQPLGWEDPLEKEMATHSSTLARKVPWTEECGRLQSMRSQRVGHDWVTSLFSLYASNI